MRRSALRKNSEPLRAMRSGPIILRLQQAAVALAGAGHEFGLLDNWSAKVEYDYLDLGSKSVTLIGSQTFSKSQIPS